MELLTFGQAKTSRIREVTQSCPDSDEFRSLVNDGTRLLMRRGDWAQTLVPIYICVRAGCVTWPRYVGKVRRINRCNTEVKVGNLWYDFVNNNSPDANYFAAGLGGNPVADVYRLVNKGRSATYADIVNANRNIRAYCSVPQDVGKTVQLFGVDTNNQPLRTNTGAGWVDGITLTLALPYVQTPGYVRRIDRVIKQPTQGNVRLYAYDPTTGLMEDLANYDPTEELPNYERDQVFLGQTCCDTSRSVTALVKLQYIPAVADTDLVMIPNIDALKLAIQAIKAREAGDREAAAGFIQDAVAELNMDLNDEYPRDQIPVDSGFSGGSYLGSQRMI